jgi:serine/threonine protein kinase
MMTDFTDRTLGQYQILEELGRGGMAVVYKAYHPALERYVAIKLLPRELTFDREFVKRFLREARSAAKLNHPHIVTIHDVGQAEGNHFIVMEYIDGPSLTDLLQRQGRIPPQRAARIVSQVASALDYAHRQGFVHRDVKPGNILLGAGQTAKLTDFGIVKAAEGSRLTQTGTLLGTPAYMSPQQARGIHITYRTDIYSLGVVAYEMLAGRVPFNGETMAVLHAHAYDPPDLSILPRRLQHVVRKALEKDPRKRFKSAGAFARSLTRAASQASAAGGRPPARAISARKAAPSRPLPGWLWGVGAAAVVLTLGLVLALTAGNDPAVTTAQTADRTPARSDTRTLEASSTSPSRTETAMPSPTEERVMSPTPFPTPSREVELRWIDIGPSVQGRPLSVAVVGDFRSDSAVVIAGSIQGDQTNTRELVESLVDYFGARPQRVPHGVVFYLLPSINPDGNAADSRFNANGVDLNRNWNTVDWRSRAAVPGYPEGKSGSGGPHPFSEPETRATADFISGLKRPGRQVLVVVLHSSVRRSRGEIYPGGDNSLEIAYRYASTAGYDVEDQWAEYTTSGEMVTWCAEQGILSIDIVVPASQHPSSRVPGTNETLRELTVHTLLDVIESFELQPPGEREP